MGITGGWSVLLIALVVAGASPSRAAPIELPNLVPLPSGHVVIESVTSSEPAALRFEASTANRGDHALELFGTPNDTESAVASQCIAWVTDRICEQRAEVGEFVWHPDHGHYHFEDFARYELRRFRRSGDVDMRPRGLVATSGKVSYCVIDVEQDRDDAFPFPYPLYYSCLAGAGFQGISAGWRDVYSSDTPGQEFSLEGLRDGRYALVLYSDPSDRLQETDEGDNFSVTGIEISDGLSRVELVCASEPGSLACLP